jgi:hypothetical protein
VGLDRPASPAQPSINSRRKTLPHHNHIAASGTIIHIFDHRFVVQTAQRSLLADLTPRGAEQIALRIGDEVKLEGEMKPSELKVTRLMRDGKTVDIEHHKKHHGEDHDADPRQALQAVRVAGFDTLGQPRRKPKHFEILGRRNQQLAELHVEFNGEIRKTKPADPNDPKWAEALGQG